MSILKIARMGHPVLLQAAAPVEDPTDNVVRTLVNDMLSTMEDAGGVGLAAPQVHESRRVIVFKAPSTRNPNEDLPTDIAPVTVLINPEFEQQGDEISLGWEGCLSIPGITGAVPRFTRIAYRGYDTEGRLIEREATNFHARVVQHEIDHLDGILYPMRINDLSLLSFNEELRYALEAERSDSSDARRRGE